MEAHGSALVHGTDSITEDKGLKFPHKVDLYALGVLVVWFHPQPPYVTDVVKAISYTSTIYFILNYLIHIYTMIYLALLNQQIKSLIVPAQHEVSCTLLLKIHIK